MRSSWTHCCDLSQDTLGLLDHLGTLLAYVQLVLTQIPGFFSTQHLSPRPVVLHGIVVTQGQDSSEHHTSGLGSLIQLVQYSLQSLPTLQLITPSHGAMISKLTEGVLNALVWIIYPS